MNNVTPNNTFIFIPDISGFSKFVHRTSIQHSKHIIAELLELIIDSDDLNLKVSEIEGDAVLFFNDEIPSLNAILNQVAKTFIRFHNHLKRYEIERICRCGACETASKLSLKFVVHQGPVEINNIKDHLKLHGSDIIIAHRLLKNSIHDSQYVLFTEKFQQELSVISSHPKAESWIRDINPGHELYEQKSLNYSYILLDPLFNKTTTPDKIKLPVVGGNALDIEIKIDCNVDHIYEIFSDLDLRKEWAEDIQEIFLQDDHLNQTGSLHTCIVNHKPMNIQTLGREEDDKKISYAEQVNQFGFFRNITRVYTFIKHHDHTHLRLEMNFELKYAILLLFRPLLIKKLKRFSIQNLNRLKAFCENSAVN